jgi:hypothetical protein
MASFHSKGACNLSTLVLQVRQCGQLTGDATERVFGHGKPTSPLRRKLERRSDRSFVHELHTSLRDMGISAETSTGYIVAVINTPTVFITSPGGDEVLQAILVQESSQDDSEILLITLRATVDRSKPPRVTSCRIEAAPVDASKIEEQADLAEGLEEWWREFQVREITLPPSGAPGVMVWFGDPHRCGYHDVPADWEARVRTLGSVCGMRVLIAKSPDEASAQSLYERAEVMIRPSGGRPWPDLTQHAHEPGKVLIEAGTAGSSFQQLLRSTRIGLLPNILEPAGTGASRPRELTPGEVVYHRKIREGRNFDLFDAGSHEPCIHGRNSFQPWNGAAKAAKGMARRYTNFSDRDVQLMHCRRYPKCGMYAVTRRDRDEDQRH